ncbi:hypothetical protein ABZ371_18720 [Streptomyces sp. NPDC005899]|uniref:hypothetical protein n=1 Tax=Streptomyces sp. NPDC005899 TaxID=3155716 RepID=UPI00340A725B
MRTSRIATVLGGMAAATLLTIGQAAAVTVEVDVAGDTQWPAGTSPSACASADRAQGCFAHVGDWFSILDRQSDGHSAVIVWRMVDSQSVVTRQGTIWNNGGADWWRYQNKNLTEYDSVEFKVCAGEWSSKAIVNGTCSGYVHAEI